MSKLNIDNWKTFSISEIFQTEQSGKNIQVPTGAMVSKRFLKDGSTPRVTVSNFNNGITGFYSDIDDKNYRIYENFISVSFLGTVFYQKNKASLDMKVHCLKPISHELNLYIATFIVNVVRKAISNFAYQDQLSSTVLPLLTIKLPARDGKPDWEYMESYMKNIMQESEQNISKLKSIDINKNKIDINNWKKFHLYDKDLFIIDMGTKLDKSKMTVDNPSVNFVGRANTNNGITVSVDKIFGLKPYQAGNMTLSLGGEYLGSCFVQPKEFYTSQNVVVLIPQWDMPNEVKNFISTMIFKESRTHYKAFVNELNRHIKTDFSFYLPVDLNNKPDWEYMENYMKSIMQDTKSKLDKLVCC